MKNHSKSFTRRLTEMLNLFYMAPVGASEENFYKGNSVA